MTQGIFRAMKLVHRVKKISLDPRFPGKHNFITDKNCSPWRDVEWADHSNHDTTCQGRILDLDLRTNSSEIVITSST